MPLVERTSVVDPLPALWGEPPPRHFDLSIPCWVKAMLVVTAVVMAICFLDQRIATFAKAHPIPDLGDSTATYSGATVGRELMFLEQWGQGVCSVIVVLTVAVIDPAGRRRALSIGLGCLITLLLTYLLKDMVGRSRPFVFAHDGAWHWGGPAMGFFHGSKWGSFPSAHTSGAFALSAGLAWFYPRGRMLFMTLALITAAQRVLHTAHYLSDVLAGMAISVFTVRWTLSHRLAGRLIALAVPRARAWWMYDAPRS